MISEKGPALVTIFTAARAIHDCHIAEVSVEVTSSLSGASLVCLWALYTLAKGEGSDIEDGSYE